MKTEGVLGKEFRQEVGVLVIRLYVRDFKLSIRNMLSQKVVTRIDVFRVRVRHGVNCHVDRTLIILENWMHGSPKLDSRKRHTCRKKSASLKPSVIAT